MIKKIAILLTMLVIGTVTVSAESFAGAEKMGEKILDTFMQRGTYVKVINSERNIIRYIPKSSIDYIRMGDGIIKIMTSCQNFWYTFNNPTLTPISLDEPTLTPISLDKDCNLILKTSLPNYEFKPKKTTYPWE